MYKNIYLKAVLLFSAIVPNVISCNAMASLLVVPDENTPPNVLKDQSPYPKGLGLSTHPGGITSRMLHLTPKKNKRFSNIETKPKENNTPNESLKKTPHKIKLRKISPTKTKRLVETSKTNVISDWEDPTWKFKQGLKPGTRYINVTKSNILIDKDYEHKYKTHLEYVQIFINNLYDASTGSTTSLTKEELGALFEVLLYDVQKLPEIERDMAWGREDSQMNILFDIYSSRTIDWENELADIENISDEERMQIWGAKDEKINHMLTKEIEVNKSNRLSKPNTPLGLNGDREISELDDSFVSEQSEVETQNESTENDDISLRYMFYPEESEQEDLVVAEETQNKDTQSSQVHTPRPSCHEEDSEEDGLVEEEEPTRIAKSLEGSISSSNAPIKVQKPSYYEEEDYSETIFDQQDDEIIVRVQESESLKLSESKSFALHDAVYGVTEGVIRNIDSASRIYNDFAIAAGDDKARAKRFWSRGFASYSKQSGDHKFKVRSNGGIVGADIDIIEDKLILGAAFTKSNTKVKIPSSSHMKASASIGSIYSRYNISDSFIINGNISYGALKIQGLEEKRKYNNGNLFNSAITIAHRILIRDNSIIIMPKAGIGYDSMKVNYRNGIKSNNLSSNIGLSIGSSGFQIGDSLVVKPSIHAGAKYIIAQKKSKINISSSSYNKIDELSPRYKSPKDMYNLGASVQMIHNRSVSLDFGYDLNFRNKYKSHSGFVKLEVKF